MNQVAASSKLGNGRFYQYRGFILLAMFALVIWLNFSFIKPLVMGAIFAIVLFPFMTKFDHYKRTKNWSTTLRASIVTFCFTVIILIPLGTLLFMGAETALTKAQGIQGLNLSSGSMAPGQIVNTLGLDPLIDKADELLLINRVQVKQYATRGIASASAFVVGLLQGMVRSLPGIVFANIVIIFTLFFLLIDGRSAVRFLRQNSIFNSVQTERLMSATVALCNSVIVATIISGAVQAAIVGLACLAMGTDGAILFAFVTFIASFFPVVGTAPVLLFLAAQAFFLGENTHGIIYLILMPIVGTSDNIVRPWVLSDGAELHPLIGFVAAFGALDAIGFYGLFIGPIVAGLFFVLLPMVTRTYPRTPRFI